MREIVLFFLFCVLSSALTQNSNPFRDPNICGRPTCTIDEAKFKYGPSSQQTYHYTVDVRSLFNGTSKNESTLSIKSIVNLEFLTPCEGLLTLRDLKLTEGDKIHSRTDEFSSAVSEFSLRFSFLDGIITELCPNNNEKIWVLNLKRGVLSMLQNSMRRFDLDTNEIEEDDVKGKCKTKYVVVGTEKTSLIVEKVKDLYSCTSRSRLHSAIQSVPYGFRSKIQPEESLIKSSSRCVLSIDHHIYDSIKCTESYLMKPFSNRGSGVTTIVKQNLILTEEKNTTAPTKAYEITKRVSIFFDHTPSSGLVDDNVQNARTLISNMCKMDSDDDHIQFSDIFTNLVNSLRLLTPHALREIFDHSGTMCSTGKKNVIDALPYVETTGAFAIMKEMILKKQIRPSTIDDWMFSLSLAKHPDEEMMEGAADLLQRSPFDSSVVLSIGALTHTFCAKNPNCNEFIGVQRISDHLEKSLFDLYNKELNVRENLEKMVVLLKAVGNAGQLSPSLKDFLVQLIEDSSLDIEIKIGAVECHRRVPCDESKDYFEGLYRDYYQDAELRIAAYLQIMRCPDYLMMRTIRNTLEQEEVNQVGSFVWSHLNNLLKSAVPSRVEIQGLLSDKDLVKKFSSDLRKFSHNYEGSLFFEEYNIGGNYDSNLIFSTKSYIPSSASFNFTVDLFGESINMFEVTARVKGFENYLESLFGPKGPWSYSKLQDKLPKMRFAREIGNELLKSQLQSIPNVMENEFGDPKVSFGVRIFGNDLKYMTYNGYEEMKEAIDHLNPIHYFQRFISKKEIDFHKAMMFLDSKYSIPTGAGLPISLSAVGTSSITMKLSGDLKAENFSKKRELDLQADIKPTISLDLTGSLEVDAFYTKTGLKVKTSMYSSTAIEGEVSVKGFKLAKVHISIPQPRSEIFNSRSELLVMKHGKEVKQHGLKEYVVTRSICSWPVIDKTLGIKSCLQYHFVNVTKMRHAPYFVLAGPASVRIFIEKLDPNAKDFIFEYKWVDIGDTSAVSMTFDAPGSSLGRIVASNFSIDRQTKNLTLVIKTTAGTAVARGNYKNTADEKYIQLAIDFNNFKHFDTSLSLSRKQIQHGYEYFPKFYLGVNNERVVEIQGTIEFVSKRGISQYHVDMHFQTKRVTAKMFGYISKKQVTIATQLRLLYKFPKAPEQGVDLAFSLANRSKRNFMDIQGSARFESSSYPQYDFDSKLKLLRGHAHTEGDFNITFNHKDDPIKWTKFGLQVIDKSLDDGTRKIKTVISFSKLAKNIDVNADFNYQSRGPSTNVDLIVDYAKNKRFSTAVFWYHNKRPLLDFKLDLNVTVPTFHPMTVHFKLDEKQPSYYDVALNSTWFSNHSLSAYGVYIDKSTSRSYDYHAKMWVKSPSFQDVLCNLRYHRDKNALKLVLKFDQNNSDYWLLIKHLNTSPQDSSTLAEVKYQSKIFSMLTTVHSGDHQHVAVEVHIDQMRDLHFAAWVHNKASYKAAGIELKWDANRDPNQKLVLSGNFTKLAPFNYVANLLGSYPGRTLLGNYEFVLKHGHVNTLVSLSWDDDQSFAVIFNSDFNFDKQKYLIADSEIVTPFENWKQTFINAGFEHDLNMYSLNGSIAWEKNQHISVDLFGNYTINDDILDCEFRSTLSSTLKNIPSLSASLAHAQNDSKVDTILRLQYTPEDIIDIKSKWEVVADGRTKNYTGTVVTSTPFSGFNKGYLISKVMITKDRYLRGVADLDFDFKKFSISAEGRLKKLTNSMLTVNITTPIEKYSTITGKFGFIEDQRYLVAMVTYPSKIMGVEVLLSIQSLTEFDTKFILGTPLDVLQRVIVIGKLKPECADFRAGWNSLLGGFTGKWHYANRLDFEYSYIIYTPLEGFEESSIILKVMVKEGLDAETSVKLSGQKLGLKVFGETKPALLRELGIRLDEIYGKKNRTGTVLSNEKEEYDDDDLLNWSGLVEIDTLINPTIKGTLDIDQKGPVYTIKSKLTMPDGLAVINDRLEFYGPLMMKNKLQISTPYRSFKQINSNYEMDISPGQNYILSVSLSYLNGSELVHNELTGKYLILKGKSNFDKTHNVTLHAETPAVTFLNIDGGGILRIQNTNVDRRYSSNVYFIASNIDVASEAELKVNKSAIYGDLYLRAKTASIYVPPVYLKYMRKTQGNNEQVELHLDIPEIYKNEIYVHSDWSYISIRQFNFYLNVQTPFDGFQKSIVGIQLTPKADAQIGNVVIDISPVEAIINNTFKNDVFTSVAQMKLSGKSIPVFLECNVIKSTPLSRQLEGILTIGKKQLNITGNIEIANNLPMGIHVEFIPKEGSDVAILDYKITSSEDSKYSFVGSAKNMKNYINLNVDTKVLSVVDWDAKAKLETSLPQYKEFTVDATCRKEGQIKTLKLEAQTPIKKLEHLELGACIKNTKDDNDVQANFEIPNMNGTIHVNWLWIYLENMRVDLTSQLNTEHKKKSTILKGHYINPKKQFKELRVGGNIDLDKKWSTGSDITLILPNIQNVTIDGTLKLPSSEVHMAKGKLIYTTPIDQVEFLAKYNTEISRKNYAVNGTTYIISEGEKNRITGNFGIEWAPNKGINNIIKYAEVGDGYDMVYKLSTPKYKNKKALVFDGRYRTSDLYHNLTCQFFKPEDTSVAFGKINFKELANMNGLVNITIPYENMNFAGLNFSTETSARVYNRYLEAFWPDNSAKIDAKCDITTGPTLLHRTRKGSVIIEVPIASKHRADIDFLYQESPLHSHGNATVNYNRNKILDGKYDCKTESKAGFEEDNTHVEITNSFVPIGVDYIHGYEYGAPSDEGSAPTKDTKNIKLYHLTNRSKFAIEGDVVIGTTSTGQQLGLKVKHLNKTVKFSSDYDILDQEYRQHSRLELAPATWIEYDVSLRNETVDQDFDAQRLQIDVQYPLRNFTAIGSYKIGEETISSDVKLEWDVDSRSIEAGLDWKKVSDKHEQLLLTLKHPTFEKDVTLLSEYEYGDDKIVDARVKFDYAIDTEQTFIMGGRMNDHSKNNVYNYTYYVYATHNATNLDLQGRGNIFWKPDVYSTSHYKEYQRSYLPPQPSEALIRLDLIRNLIELKRDSLGQLSHLKASYDSDHPKYTGNLSISHDYNDAIGDYYLDLDQKIFHLDYNMTTDGRQSLHMYGDIPDARNAKFNAWRDYDDIRIMDVIYYLKMNHSRLIISNLIWRPELLRELQSGFHGGLHSIYNYVIENINDTRHYVRSEIKESIGGIWLEAEPHLQNYLNDMRELRLIEEDVEHLKVFLNRSYHANDFYIKTLVGFTSYAFDELALKKHFESVPAIISEIWGIMGESGKKIQKSIEWVIEKIQTYYKNITVFTRQLLDGDPIQHLSDAFSNILEQYDDFIRKLHVAFIQYIEKLWHQTYNLIIENWHKMLIAIEPTVLKLVAYTESIAWSTSQELLDFLYIRKNEIMESPYFAKFTNFTHDVDKFYKDITGNNTLSSAVKYTRISWNFFREKYMDKLPFAKELETIIREIVGDLNQLRKLPSVAFVEERLNQIWNRLVWFYEYFDVETRLQNSLKLLHRKVTDYSQTALQAENRYRIAKTKFIFDPNQGKMQWEQKLPMSWHAFNETPNFHEIPEIKALYDVQSFFVSSHTNFWNFYYDYKPYTDPSEWFPPFKAQALIIGSNHFVTFDRKFYDFKEDCSYLLASDMKDHNFTLVISYGQERDSHELLLLVNKTVVRINIFTDVIKVGDSPRSQLPIEIDNTFIHRDSGIITVESDSGFVLECNIKFKVCTFEVSGWYFGKTAGLFGTINNEPSDDFFSSTKQLYNESTAATFARSWALDQKCARSVAQYKRKNNETNKFVAQLCDDLYANKLSQFEACFERISKQPFLDMCMSSRTVEEACSSAAAYTTLCSSENTPLRMPDSCIMCHLPNGSFIYEGELARFTSPNTQPSADVVFLIETKRCNENLTSSKNMKLLLDSLEGELVANNIMANRYAVVLFGGDGVYGDPRVRSLNGKIFTNISSVMDTLENIPIGNGSADIFNAMIYASRLNFRPAISKIFILIPCSECHEDSMKYDYPILHQLLSENAISLHILMNEDFTQKQRDNKIPYGIDSRRAYTKKDARSLKGDEILRNHIKLPKTTMGLCMPLALETNGTLFSSKYLRNGKDDAVKKFITVFTKRVAEGSNRVDCVDCECTASNNGLSFMECSSCHSSRASVDDEFEEDELLMNLQPGENIF